jgi:hypothetical protein
MILLAAEGHENRSIAATVGTSRQTVGLWRPCRQADPKPFVWTKSAQDIVAKVHRAKVALDKTRTA